MSSGALANIIGEFSLSVNSDLLAFVNTEAINVAPCNLDTGEMFDARSDRRFPLAKAILVGREFTDLSLPLCLLVLILLGKFAKYIPQDRCRKPRCHRTGRSHYLDSHGNSLCHYRRLARRLYIFSVLYA